MNVRLPAVRLSGLPVALGLSGGAIEASADEPRTDVLIGLSIAVAFFVIFLGWAAFARLDAAATAHGDITVAGHRQTVQTKDGGVVNAIYVKEAQQVRQGDVLIRLSGSNAEASERALSAQVIGLKAQRARLQAEQLGLPSIQWPAEFAALSGRDQEEVKKAEAIQETEFRSRAAAVKAQKQVLGQKTAELAEQVEGYRRQIESSDRQQKLIGDELTGIQSLAARGFAPVNKVRELQRTQAQIGGERGQYAAAIAQSQQQSGEARLQIVQVDKNRNEQISSDLHGVETALNEALPKLAAAQDELAKYQIRAPASGVVVGLSVFTVGGVLAPGEKLMDIVPDKAPLMIEARVSPNDADDLKVGQIAEVRLPTVHDRSLPALKGRVTKVSADSFTDQRTGATYFTAEVAVPLGELSSIEHKRDGAFALKPGLPVEVLVPLRKRTALQYLMEPLTDAIWKSFRDH